MNFNFDTLSKLVTLGLTTTTAIMDRVHANHMTVTDANNNPLTAAQVAAEFVKAGQMAASDIDNRHKGE